MSRHRIGILLGIGVSLVLLWWALRDVSAAEVFRHLRDADRWLLAASVAVATGTFVLRALRWKVLLLPALAGSSFGSRFSAVCIGFGANNLLPARLGEFARTYAFARQERIGISATFASIVLERVLDGLVLVLFLLPAFYLAEFEAGADPVTLRRMSTVAAAGVAVALGFLWLLARFPHRFEALLRRTVLRLLPHRFEERVAGILHTFILGLGTLRRPSMFARVLGWTVVVWLWNAGGFWLAFLAFDIRAGFPGALLLQSIIGFAVSLPSSPGFFGPFEAGARIALVPFGVEPAHILSFAVGFHLVSFFPITLLGLWYANRLGISWREVERSEEAVEAEVERAGEQVEGGGDPEVRGAADRGAGDDPVEPAGVDATDATDAGSGEEGAGEPEADGRAGSTPTGGSAAGARRGEAG